MIDMIIRKWLIPSSSNDRYDCPEMIDTLAMIDMIVRKWLIQSVSNDRYDYPEMVDTVNKQDIVAHWSVPVHDRIYEIEFEHGTASGKRVIRVDGKVCLLKNSFLFIFLFLTS
ncbi:unnamed protein product [Brugia pahangi]|uniref:Neur_chan_LBD domain-containing protein n=1 Tax=Brugia pahangi TaxID=6280 RepID=A0A0N4TEQ3_BRUPA|nr:unnamed protein product [Brugia pahangi]